MPTIESHSDGPNYDSKERLPAKNVRFFDLVETESLVHEGKGILQGVEVEDSLTGLTELWIGETVLG